MVISKSARKQLGHAFEKEFKDTQEQLGNLVIKFPDTRQISGMVQAVIGSNNFIAAKVPCDFIVIEPTGRVSFVECKRTACASFPRANVKQHQIDMMCEIQHFIETNPKAAGYNMAWFVINFYKRKKFARNPERDIKCWIKPHRLKELFDAAEREGRVSIPMDWLTMGKPNNEEENKVSTGG